MAIPESRWCNKCETSWPYTPEFIKCPTCEGVTAPAQENADFNTESLALLWATTEIARREKQERYDYFDWCIDSAHLERDLADMMLTNEADLAAHFAKLEKLPTKEVTSDR